MTTAMRTILITGASSGIGAALAVEAARRGLAVALLARREDKLEEVAARCREHGGRVFWTRCDVSVDADVRRALGEAAAALGPIDTVVANAAALLAGAAHEVPMEEYRRILDTNVFGVLSFFLAAHAGLEEAAGRFAIVGSLSSYTPAQGAASYVMSKHALLGLARTLQLEAKASGSRVSVTFLAPGAIETDILRVDPESLPEGIELEHGDRMTAWMSAEEAARQSLDAIDRRAREVVLTWQGRLLNRLYPVSEILWGLAASYFYGVRRKRV